MLAAPSCLDVVKFTLQEVESDIAHEANVSLIS